MTLLRPVRFSDVPTIIAIENSCFESPWEPDIFETLAGWDGEVKLADSGIAFMRVADEEGDVVGYIIWMVHLDKSRGYIANIAVTEEHRGSGIGTSMLKHAFDNLRTREIPRCSLEVRESNHAARRFYEKAGMTPSGRVRDYYSNEDAITYSIDL